MAAQNGTIVLKGLKTGKTYFLSAYFPDATATALTFNPAGLAGSTSPADYRAPEDCVLTDYSLTAAPTAVGMVLKVNGALVNGGAFMHAQQLAANPNRPKIQIGIKGGDFISALQY